MSKKKTKILIIMSGIVVTIVGVVVKFWDRLVRLVKNIRNR